MAKTAIEQLEALKTRHAADALKIAELEASIKAASALATLKKEDVIEFNYGRGETRGQFSGEVRSIFETDKGQRIKVLYGEGAEEQIVVIAPNDVIRVVKQAQETDAPAALDPLAAAADPLAGIN
jgi:sRNA-binding protein